MNISDRLTIVIPCKNERDVISKTLDLLNYQEGIEGTQVIVCDDSTDEVTPIILDKRNKDKFNLKVISGGIPSVARNKGAYITETPYILFMDADIFILDQTLIKDSLARLMRDKLHLVSCKFNTTNGKYNLTYNVFHKFQKLTKRVSPFALGGFMMMELKVFNEVGGFDETVRIAEDYQLTRKIKPNKFAIIDGLVFTTPRRFENKGLWYMTKIMFGSYRNRNNKKYFEDDHNYWI